MGNSDSEKGPTKGKGVEVKFEGDEQVYHNPKSQVLLQQPLIDRLFEVSDDHPSASRQAMLDSSIQQKLKADRERLKQLGSEVDSKVREAFRKQSSSQQAKDDDKSNSSAQLMEEISSIKERVQQRRNDNTSELLPQINHARSAIVACLKQYQDQPLKCTEQVDNFKKVVRNLESKFVTSMQ
ncbi:hypothetical protein PTTG_06905 [Puccinia triticina 1-1 BBBD Race 1]|uniref:Uncharacterized protein n=2 Tax=Puccinia triticina TaxID=208348 RepID=A0A180GB91_PUCT1|nr:uncharacterized protein PtA15_13A395 [Puccinia triticina]OAV89163.1 hypothetical protein PTTG_06905 [Puccinia triticina 1-1 BBBD Race 1]WAQ90995.1 hypothetical protein PtA15_13A395 [Puccinia triticina]WAR61184.1 hypothetical protein PtB15_13B436 [Puccinia triticina]